MKLYSAEALPPSIRVQQMFDLIVHTGMASLGSYARGSLDERSEIVRQRFMSLAPDEANAIVGVRISTSVVLNDIGGGGELFLTYSGNPAIIDEAG